MEDIKKEMENVVKNIIEINKNNYKNIDEFIEFYRKYEENNLNKL